VLKLKFPTKIFFKRQPLHWAVEVQARCGGLAGRGHLPENRHRSWRTVECGTKYSRFVKLAG